MVLTGRLLGTMVFLIAALILAEYRGFHLFSIDTILAPDAKSLIPGRISIEAGLVFMVMGIILMNIRARKRPMAHVTDFTTLVLVRLEEGHAHPVLKDSMSVTGASRADGFFPVAPGKPAPAVGDDVSVVLLR